MTVSTPDLLVTGLGAVGSATLLHAAGQGMEVLGIDRSAPPHSHGSTHGESRITRLAIGEGAQYVPLVRRSHGLWRELEKASGRSLYRACGGLVLARSGAASPMHGQSGFFDKKRSGHPLVSGKRSGHPLVSVASAQTSRRLRRLVLV
jgi:sarcosine oxidase